jgi:hypothetical protein
MRLRTEGPVVRPAIAERLLRTAYQTEYGIFDHPNHGNFPLDCVKLHPKEDFIEGGAVRSNMRKFARLEVGDIFKVSWNEFKDLPFDEAQFMLEYAESAFNRKASDTGTLTRQLERDMRQAGIKP